MRYKAWECALLPTKSSSLSKAPTLAILLLLSAVRKDMLLISFWTTKFCSSRLKFWWGRQCRGSGWGAGIFRQQLRVLWRGGVQQVGTHMGLGPVDEDLAHHPEQLLGAGIRLCQPVRPGEAGEGASEGRGRDTQDRGPHREISGEGIGEPGEASRRDGIF